MKKTKLMLLLLFIVVVVSSFLGVYADSNIGINIDNEALIFEDVKPFIDEANRTMIPVRAVSESLGATVGWDANKRMVSIDLDDKHIELVIDSSVVFANGVSTQIDTEAKIVNDRTFVPVRFVSENLGFKVDWDSVNRTVLIQTEDIVDVETPNMGGFDTLEQVKHYRDSTIEVKTKHVTLPAIIDGVNVENITFEDITLNGISFNSDYLKVIQDKPVLLTVYFDNNEWVSSTLFTIDGESDVRHFEYNGKYVSLYEYDRKLSLNEMKNIDYIGLKSVYKEKNNLIWVDNPIKGVK